MTALPGKPAANATPENESGVERLLVSSPGARLQKGREAANLSVKQAADVLHLSPGVVKALEADDYRALPNATFVKGYIRSYSRIVGIPGEELVRSYEAITGNGQAKPVEPVQAPRNGPQLGMLIRLGAAVAVVLAILVAFWPSSDAESEAPLAVAGSEQLVTSVAEVPVAEEAEAITAEDIDAAAEEGGLEALAQDSQEPAPELEVDELSPEEVEPVMAPVDEVPSGAVTESPVLADVREPLATQNPDSLASPFAPSSEAAGVLSMAFTGDCWVEVRDGTNALIFSNLKRHGDTLTLNGVPPFEAKLGNGNVVSVSYNGQPVSFHVPSHNVVRVRLGE